MKTYIIIPARLESTRLPRKMLLDKTGMPLVVHTALAAQERYMDNVYVATDSNEIIDVCAKYGVRAIKTVNDHVNGTSRVAEAFKSLCNPGLIINLQGDEPEVDLDSVDRLVSMMLADQSVMIGTLATQINNPCDIISEHVVKVVVNCNHFAMYFSRSAIPFKPARHVDIAWYRHIGIYAYRPDVLERYHMLGYPEIERAERLEQLRFLYAGIGIKVIDGIAPYPGIDTLADYDTFCLRYYQSSKRAG